MVWDGVASGNGRRGILVVPKAALAAAAALVLAASAAQAAGSESANLAGVIGKPIAPFGRMMLHEATLRTPKQMEAFEAAHPRLDLRQSAYRPRIPMGDAAYRAAKRLASDGRGGSKFTLANAVPPPGSPSKLLLKADGPSESDTGNASFPPDISGALGGGQVVVVVNSTFNVYNRSGASLLHESLNSLIGTTDMLTEPRVLYDPMWQRWIVAVLREPDPATAPVLWLAISETENARGAFHVYHVGYEYSPGDTYDYPMVGMTQDSLMFTANYFSGDAFSGSAVYAIPKAKAYNGSSATTFTFLAQTASGTVAPPIVLDDNINAYFVGANTANHTIDLYKGTNLNSISQATFGLQAQIASGVSVPPAAPQHNSTQTLDTLDGRFQAPSYQHGTTLWNISTVHLGGNFMGPQYYKVDTGGNTITQSGYFFESQSSSDFNASLAANANDEVIVTWSATDPGLHNARMRYAGWQTGDSTLYITPGSLLETSGPALSGNTKSGNLQAWGAYSAVALDANSFATCSNTPNRRAAIFNERIVDRNTWGTEMGIVGFC